MRGRGQGAAQGGVRGGGGHRKSCTADSSVAPWAAASAGGACRWEQHRTGKRVITRALVHAKADWRRRWPARGRAGWRQRRPVQCGRGIEKRKLTVRATQRKKPRRRVADAMDKPSARAWDWDWAWLASVGCAWATSAMAWACFSSALLSALFVHAGLVLGCPVCFAFVCHENRNVQKSDLSCWHQFEVGKGSGSIPSCRSRLQNNLAAPSLT